MSDTIFGCPQCMPADAEEAWAAKEGFHLVAELVEESHYSVRITACPACGQHFVDVFTERIDWVNGEDPQSSAVLPVTEAEAEALAAQGEKVSQRLIESFGVARRYLRWDYPSATQPSVHWAQGNFWIGPHD
jgi:hypothetical protein